MRDGANPLGSSRGIYYASQGCIEGIAMFANIQTSLYDSVLNGNAWAKDGKTKYKVILEGIAGPHETKDSFAIKFSILAKIPVSRTKFWIRNAPFVVWKGLGKRNAQKHLSIIKESGGKGTITEVEMSHPMTKEDSDNAGGERVCSKCGSPLSKDDKFCPFCAAPIEPVLPKKNRQTTVYNKTSEPAVPKGRMVFYLIAIVALILFALLSS